MLRLQHFPSAPHHNFAVHDIQGALPQNNNRNTSQNMPSFHHITLHPNTTLKPAVINFNELLSRHGQSNRKTHQRVRNFHFELL
jgi:hypothetical protein